MKRAFCNVQGSSIALLGRTGRGSAAVKALDSVGMHSLLTIARCDAASAEDAAAAVRDSMQVMQMIKLHSALPMRAILS